jgi:hypothetical protein
MFSTIKTLIQRSKIELKIDGIELEVAKVNKLI